MNANATTRHAAITAASVATTGLLNVDWVTTIATITEIVDANISGAKTMATVISRIMDGPGILSRVRNGTGSIIASTFDVAACSLSASECICPSAAPSDYFTMSRHLHVLIPMGYETPGTTYSRAER